MKFNDKIISLISLQLLLTTALFAQQQDAIPVAYDQTSTLVLQETIQSIDVGSPGVLVQRVNGFDNMLRLKAAVTDFDTTNLTIYAMSGAIYHFNLYYAAHPQRKVWPIAADDSLPIAPSQLSGQGSMQSKAQWVLRQTHPTIRKQHHGQLTLSVRNLYSSGGKLFFHLQIENTSALPFKIHNIRFYTTSRNAVKRSAQHEETRSPLLYYKPDAQSLVTQGGKADMVMVYDQFSLPRDQEGTFEVLETQGGRRLTLSLRHKHMRKAQTINNYPLNPTQP
ncbi:conjugative transposon protein TraN [Fulvivirga maritima]|uniref:DUF4138 domain-containing protein n=1 Tax=Fulvivirga maritima TaxID=2904247 RepID=UPI001F2E4D5E|nr:DUF4138 domain-containing protein [Fulvivirga maritima]UII29089.1 conjugative transposon protein TraN [Fulvivirga maritima]